MDVAACAKADATFYAQHPELKRRHLTTNPTDALLRGEWSNLYHQAIVSKLKPPTPVATPQPAQIPPPPAGSVQICPFISSLSHQEKMEMAIKGATLAPEIKEQLGDPKAIVASMLIVGGSLAALAATGYGAVAEGIGAGLLVLGSFVSGYQMGGGIVDLASFFNGTRCDTAKSPQDIQNASQQFASGLAKIGVGGFFFLLGLAGAKKGAPKSEGIEPFASQPTFRGDGRAPGVIFEDGLQPRGTSADLESYVKSNKASSFVGTSKSESVAAGFAHVQGGGYVYTVDPKGLAGIDVNKAFPGNPFPYEQEIVFPGGISSKNIVGARPVANDGTIGDFIPNPKYNPTK